MLNGGGVRASIDERSRNGNIFRIRFMFIILIYRYLSGSITYGDLRAVAPFPNTVDVVKINGKTLKDMLEFSVHEYDPTAIEPFGGFLQVSGSRLLSVLTERYLIKFKRNPRIVWPDKKARWQSGRSGSQV